MSWLERPAQAEVNGLRLSLLGPDQAFVNVSSERPGLWLYRLSQECSRCPFLRVTGIDDIKNALQVSTQYQQIWRVLADGSLAAIPERYHSRAVCEISPDMGEFGVYDLRISNAGNEVRCDFSTVAEPVNIYLPLVLCAAALLALWLLCSAASASVSRWRQSTQSPLTRNADQRAEANGTARGDSRRLKSLDAFRGITIVMMIFVNHGAGGYAILQHTTWEGVHLADFVNPWFCWIMGVCVPISVTSQFERNIFRSHMIRGVFRRSCILFLLGLMVSSREGSKLETLRIFGVLQRYAVVYLVVATLYILFTKNNIKSKVECVEASRDTVTMFLPQWAVIVAVVSVHCTLTFLLPVPGCRTGYLGPGGDHEDGQHKECIGGSAGYIDKLVLGEDHLIHLLRTSNVYGSGPFDPNGLLGCLPMALQAFLGVQAGSALLLQRGWRRRLAHWLLWGAATGAGGAVLAAWIPINKKLWSLSFVLVTTCFAFYLLNICYVLIDVKKWWSGSPFFYVGMNPIIMYIGHSITYKLFPWHWSIGKMNTHFMCLLENIWGTLLWIVVSIWLYRVKFFLSI